MSEPTREELDAILERHRDALAAEKDWRRNRVYDEVYEWLNAAEDFADEVDRLQGLLDARSLPDDAASVAVRLVEVADFFETDRDYQEFVVTCQRAAEILRGEV